MKFWTRRRKEAVYPVLAQAEREGRLEEAVHEIARRYDRRPEEVLAVYRRLKKVFGD